MLPTVRIRSYWLLGPLALLSCQLVSGLDELEVVPDGSGGQGSGGVSSAGGTGSGGTPDPSCVVGWADDPCQGQCGDPGDGIHTGCGKLMECYVANHCLPEVCSADIDGVCGINEVAGANPDSLAMAEEVVNCLCYSPPP